MCLCLRLPLLVLYALVHNAAYTAWSYVLLLTYICAAGFLLVVPLLARVHQAVSSAATSACAAADVHVPCPLLRFVPSAAPAGASTSSCGRQQRRYLVSELLPDSGAPEPKPAAAAGKAGDKGKGKPAAPLVPQGAMKAQAIIAAALAEADAAVAAKRLAEPQAPVQEEHSEHEEEAEEEAAAPAAPAGEFGSLVICC